MLLFSYLLMSGVTTGALYALVALGIVVVNKATGVINFAQGEFFMFTGFVGWMLHVQFGMNYPLSFLLAVIVGFLLGLLTDRIAFRPIAKTDIVSLVLATVGIGFILKGLARVIWGGKADYLSFPPITSPDPIMVGSLMVIPQQLAVLAGTVIIMLIFAAFFRLTRAGKMMQATADNSRAALLVGIRTDRIYTLAFGTGAAIAAAAAVLTAPLTLLYPGHWLCVLPKGFCRRGAWRPDEPAWRGPRRAYRRHRRVDGGRLHPFQRDGAVAVPRHHDRAGAAADRPSQLPQGTESVVPLRPAQCPARTARDRRDRSRVRQRLPAVRRQSRRHLHPAGDRAQHPRRLCGATRFRQRRDVRHRRLCYGPAAGASRLAVLGSPFRAEASLRRRSDLACAAGASHERSLSGAVHARVRASDAVGVPALGERDLRRRRLQDAATVVRAAADRASRSVSTTSALFSWFFFIFFARHVVTSRIGRAFVAVRDGEVAAESLGIDLLRYKALAFGISGFYAGVAGGLYSAMLNFVAPEGYDLFQMVIQKAMIVVGGMGSIAGSVIGAVDHHPGARAAARGQRPAGDRVRRPAGRIRPVHARRIDQCAHVAICGAGKSLCA